MLDHVLKCRHCEWLKDNKVLFYSSNNVYGPDATILLFIVWVKNIHCLIKKTDFCMQKISKHLKKQTFAYFFDFKQTFAGIWGKNRLLHKKQTFAYAWPPCIKFGEDWASILRKKFWRLFVFFFCLLYHRHYEG